MTRSHDGGAMPAKALPTRRAALASIASAGALIVPAASLPAPALAANELSSLIDAHRAARDVLDRATENQEAAEPDDEALIPGPDGCFYEAGLGADTVRGYIERDFAAHHEMASTLSRLSPALGEQARALLEARKASCLARVEEVFAAHSAAVAVWDDANDAEEESVMAVCAHRCASIEEAAIKFRYLFHESPFKDELQSEHIEALAASFLPEGA